MRLRDALGRTYSALPFGRSLTICPTYTLWAHKHSRQSCPTCVPPVQGVHFVHGVTVGSVVAALLGTSVYYVAFLLFRVAAHRMPPLRGSRPFHAAWYMLTDL